MTRIIVAPVVAAYIYEDGSSIENDVAMAASYLAACAFTKPEQGKKAENFVNSVRAISFKAHGQHAPPDLKGIKKERIDGSINDAMILIKGRRWPARWMFLKLIGADADYPIPPGRSTLKVTDAAALLGDPSATKDKDAGAILDKGDTPNMSARVWYETLPALAMVMALPPPRESVREWLKYPDWVPDAVERAALWADYITEIIKPKVLYLPQICAVRV